MLDRPWPRSATFTSASLDVTVSGGPYVVEHVEQVPRARTPLLGNVPAIVSAATRSGCGRLGCGPGSGGPSMAAAAAAQRGDAAGAAEALGSTCATSRDRRAAGPDRPGRAGGGRRRPARAPPRLPRARAADLAVQLGETGPLDEAALAERMLRRARRLLLRAQHGAGGAAARRSGSSSPTIRRSSAAKGRRTTWRCSCTSTASAGWRTPASARATSTRCRSARARPDRAVHLHARARGRAARGGWASTSGARSAASG